MYYPTFEPQTTVVPSREHLVAGIEELEKQYPDKDNIPLPASLKGVYVVPDQIETWHSGRDGFTTGTATPRRRMGGKTRCWCLNGQWRTG